MLYNFLPFLLQNFDALLLQILVLTLFCPINVKLLRGDAKESTEMRDCRDVTVALYCRKLGLGLEFMAGDPAIFRLKVKPYIAPCPFACALALAVEAVEVGLRK